MRFLKDLFTRPGRLRKELKKEIIFIRDFLKT